MIISTGCKSQAGFFEERSPSRVFYAEDTDAEFQVGEGRTGVDSRESGSER